MFTWLDPKPGHYIWEFSIDGVRAGRISLCENKYAFGSEDMSITEEFDDIGTAKKWVETHYFVPQPLRIAFNASEAIVAVFDVSIAMKDNRWPEMTDIPSDYPYRNQVVDLAMQLYCKYIEMREWAVVNKPKETIVENEITVFIPGSLFAVMQQHPKWECVSWFQGSLFGTPFEMHRVLEDSHKIYWGYRGDEMIIVIGRISCLNVYF